MKLLPILCASAAVLFGSSGVALSDCANHGTTAMGSDRSGQSEMSGRISKDGSLAPLETPNDAAAAGNTKMGDAPGATPPPAQSKPPGKVAKDGTTMPLNTDRNLATSDQDVQAQQKGGKTAAAEAQTGCAQE